MTDKKHKNESDDSVDKDDISEMTNVCNRVLSMKLAPSLVEGINGGRIDIQVLETKEYFKNYLYRLFGEKASGYASQLRLERVQLAKHPEVRLWLLHTPSKREIGQTAIIGFIYSEKSGMAAFSLEHSLNDSLTICEWGEGKHFYYDKVENKDQFVKAIVLLMSGEQVGN